MNPVQEKLKTAEVGVKKCSARKIKAAPAIGKTGKQNVNTPSLHQGSKNKTRTKIKVKMAANTVITTATLNTPTKLLTVKY